VVGDHHFVAGLEVHRVQDRGDGEGRVGHQGQARRGGVDQPADPVAGPVGEDLHVAFEEPDRVGVHPLAQATLRLAHRFGADPI
jgi:hypothetical protein